MTVSLKICASSHITEDIFSDQVLGCLGSEPQGNVGSRVAFNLPFVFCRLFVCSFSICIRVSSSLVLLTDLLKGKPSVALVWELFSGIFLKYSPLPFSSRLSLICSLTSISSTRFAILSWAVLLQSRWKALFSLDFKRDFVEGWQIFLMA